MYVYEFVHVCAYVYDIINTGDFIGQESTTTFTIKQH